jgi:cobalt-zinc-cadmium resistance protein CzcA
VEDVLRTFPEVEDVVRRTGRAERTEDPMPHTVSDVLVVLKPDRARSLPELEEAMREELSHLPGISVLFTTPLGMRIDEGLGGSPADISVRIFGPDLDTLAGLGDRAGDLVRHVRGVEDLRVERLTGLPQLRVSVDREAVARVGLTPGDVIRAVRIGLVGEEQSEIWIGQRRFDVMVRLQDHHRNDPSALRSLLIDGHDGTRIPLGQLAAVQETFAPGAIRREAGSRRIAVEASVVGRDLGSTAREVRRELGRGLKLPTGYFLDVGGRVESQSRAGRALAVAIAVALLAVFVLLYLALGSLIEVGVILGTLPTAFVGGIVALFVAGETWNVSSLVGLIGLFGIAVQNGLVLVTQTRVLVAEGRTFPEAVREASIGRVRPKLMTAGTAILGLLPLLILRLHGTEIERPLAVVMVEDSSPPPSSRCWPCPASISGRGVGSSCAERSTLLSTQSPLGRTSMPDKKPDFSNVVGGSSSTAKPAEGAAPRTYTVQKGDSLWKIAKHFYGNGGEWKRIHEANKETIHNPDVIQPGWVLRIPE